MLFWVEHEPTTKMTHSYTLQELLVLANAGDRHLILVEEGIWAWLPESEVWVLRNFIELEVDPCCADQAEMTEHIRESLQGIELEAALACQDCSYMW